MTYARQMKYGKISGINQSNFGKRENIGKKNHFFFVFQNKINIFISTICLEVKILKVGPPPTRGGGRKPNTYAENALLLLPNEKYPYRNQGGFNPPCLPVKCCIRISNLVF